MEGESNTGAVKIDIHENGKGESKSTIQDEERECPLEGDSEAKARTDHVKGSNSYVNNEENTETAQIDISVGKQNGERECLFEWKSKGESWIDHVKHKYVAKEDRRRKSSPDVSIYRVPESIKKTKRDAYDPLVVFLGPFHHNKHQQLTAMDEYKLQAVHRTMERLHGKTIEDLVSMVRELEEKIRDCYEDSAIECDGDTLAWIMTMDSCFLLEFLRMGLPNSSLIFQRERRWNIKRREMESDILKLENQIPFIVLRMIADMVYGSGAVRALAGQLSSIGGYFQGYPFTFGDYDAAQLPILIERNPCHLLDLSRQVIADFFTKSVSNPESPDFLSIYDSGSEPAIPAKCCARFRGACWTAVSSCLPPSRASSEVQYASLIPSAERLHRAGIKLEASVEGNVDFKRRLFRSSTLSVPQILVEDDTEILLRNLVAFEECQMHDDSPIKRVISSNMWIMDQLINSKEDVQLLERVDIIKNYLGTEDEVAKLFNNLCIGITSTDDISTNISGRSKGWGDIRELCRESEDLRQMSKEFQEYRCPNTWYIVSFVVAGVLFVMTLLQTIYTMKSYFQSQ